MAAIQQHRIGCFYLWGANISTWLKLAHFMRSCGRITNAIEHAPRPFIFNVNSNATLTRVTVPGVAKELASGELIQKLGTAKSIS
jgi:hypothetical protein